jgi:TRAP-type C4-dicarboxylate transport system permease small subunit
MSTDDAVKRTAGLLGWYERIVRFLAGTSMAIIVILVLAQVVSRYMFNSSIIWAEELCRYILIWQSFLLVGMAYQRGELVAVDMVPLMLSPKARFALRAITSIPILFFLYLMVTNGWSYAMRFDSQVIPALDFIWGSITGGALGVSIKWVYISVSVGCVLLAGHIIGSLIAEARGLFGHGEPPVEPQIHIPQA